MELRCSFCGKRAAKLIAAARTRADRSYICDNCVHSVETVSNPADCTFCNKRPRDTPQICEGCLSFCLRILEDDAPLHD